MAAHAVRQFGSRHNAVGRAFIPDKSIQARQLLDILPAPVQSITSSLPLVDPILTGGSSLSPPPAAPAQSPSPPSSTGGSSDGSSRGSSSGSGNSGGSSSGSGSSSGGSSSGSGSSSGGSSSGSGSGSGSSSTGSGSSGGGSSSGSGSSSGGSSSGSGSSSGGSPSGSGNSGGGSSSGSGSDGGGSGNPSTTTAPTPTTQNGTPNGVVQPSTSTSSAAGGSVLASNQSNGSSSPSGSTAQNNGGQNPSSAPSSDSGVPPIANSGGISLANTNKTGASSGSSSGIAASNPSSTGSSGMGTNNGGSSPTNNKHSLSNGGIATIVVVLFLLFTASVAVFILRRRSRMQRNTRRNRWWFSTDRTSQTYGDSMDAEIVPTRTRSARSSFIATADHSNSSHSNYVIPPFPPAMAEVGRGNGTRPALFINTYENTPVLSIIEESRFSIGSVGSDHSQYLIVNDRHSGNPDTPGGITPMSVRPFSPSESFAFPKPPEPAAGSAAGSSRPSSYATTGMLSTTSLNANMPPGLLRMTLPFTTPNNKPSSFTGTIMAPTANPFGDNNPFEDPVTSNTDPDIYTTGTFAEIEIVRRPFIPTLDDEIPVSAGDAVQVLHSFDDGWALVETIPQGSHGKGTREKSKNGLIPIDCLRKPGQELPAFIASKRVSSYAEPGCLAY